MNLTPQRYDWPTIKRGNTRPAFGVTMAGADGTLERVRCSIADSAGTKVLTLDSGTTGITITSTASGAWSFTVGPITATQTSVFTGGSYFYDLETVTTDDVERTWIEGTWEILPQITD